MNTFNRLSGQGDVLAHIEDSIRSNEMDWINNDTYVEWFLAFTDEWRNQGFHCLTGNMQGGPDIEVVRQCFADGKTPAQALEQFKIADQTFFVGVNE